ncbi:MAG: cyclic dehypoxanthinyl futalosine synthase [Candidatus Sumerlaeaceae bacterium]
MSISHILERTVDGERLSDADAIQLFRTNDLTALGAAAHAVRMRMHPDPVVTYIVERNINYSNICAADCDFCGFYAKAWDGDRAYVLPQEAIDQKIEELVAAGGKQILLQGGLHPRYKLEWYEDMLRHMKEKFGIHLHSFSPPEIFWFAKINKMPLIEVISRLHAAGLDSVPGGGGEILVDRVRTALTKNKCLTDEWLDVMRAASQCGLRGSATMMFGHIETLEERVEHLRRIRNLQDETGVFTAFIDWTYQKSPGLPLQCETVSSHEYLKTTAIARLYLDNVDNIQSSWVTQGGKVGQVSLFFGCNDMGSTMMEENVVSAAGTVFSLDAEEIERLVTDAGFEARRRNFFYDDTDEPRRKSLDLAAV